jgi:hypothetical protein
MGLAAYDLASDVSSYVSSGGFGRIASPPAIHVIVDTELLKQKFALTQGTGGNLTPFSYSGSCSGSNIVTNVHSSNQLALAIEEVSDVFGLTKDELSQVCKVQSRKSLYNWMNGDSKPRKSAMQRVFNLLILAKAVKSSGFSSVGASVHEPIDGDKSIFDLLNEDNLDQERIIFAASRLQLTSWATKALTDPFA